MMGYYESAHRTKVTSQERHGVSKHRRFSCKFINLDNGYKNKQNKQTNKQRTQQKQLCNHITGRLRVEPLVTWWRHQMETFSTLLATCAWEFTGHRWIPRTKPVTWNFVVFFDLRLNRRLCEQSRGYWFEAPSRPLWRHSNDLWWIHSQRPLIFFMSWDHHCCINDRWIWNQY